MKIHLKKMGIIIVFWNALLISKHRGKYMYHLENINYHAFWPLSECARPMIHTLSCYHFRKNIRSFLH